MDKRSGNNSRDEGTRNFDEPPMSRLFIICNKENTEDELRDCFENYGEIEDIWVVKDKKSGDNKGVVYIKYTKTSEAARALEEMNGKTIGNSSRPIKVLVANSRNQGSTRPTENEEEKYLRLFVLIPKEMSEQELSDEFGNYGEIENVTIIRDKTTKEGKGFGYVKYKKFSEAALAFESADAKYKAVFAEPKPRKDSNNDNYSGGNMRSNSRGNMGMGNNGSGFNDNFNMNMSNNRRMSYDNMGGVGSSGNFNSADATLTVLCSASVNQDQLWRLFDIVPGLDFCQINSEYSRNVNQATVVYNNQQSACYAREKIHGLEYPPGERLIVKTGSDMKMPMPLLNDNNMFNNMSSGGGGGGGFNNSRNNFDDSDSFCSVQLPSTQQLADENAICAQRCFIVCVPQALPHNVLRNVFCRFGGLIDVYLLNNKNCGYARYTNENSCRRAIDSLHGAEVCGVRLKVMEAEELNSDNRRKRQRRNDE